MRTTTNSPKINDRVSYVNTTCSATYEAVTGTVVAVETSGIFAGNVKVRISPTGELRTFLARELEVIVSFEGVDADGFATYRGDFGF